MGPDSREYNHVMALLSRYIGLSGALGREIDSLNKYVAN